MMPKKKLIYADDVLATLADIIREFPTPVELYDDGILGGLDRAFEIIEQASAINAVVMPCKVGDKVYRIAEGNYHSNYKPFVQELTVTEISWKKEKHGTKDLGFAIIADGIRYRFSSIGKSVFLSKEEAEAKMNNKPFEVLQIPKPKIEKIRTPFARIMVSGTLENPYYDILYYDPNDKKFHVGYGSFCLEFVFEWLSDVFEIIEPDSVPNLLENGLTEEIEPCQITVDRQCCSCGIPMAHTDKYCPNCGIKMIRLPEKRGK